MRHSGSCTRFHEHMPEAIRPSIGTSNAEELIFDRIDSGYIVTVATNEGTGRSATDQCLHASEAAFWQDLPQQAASLMQTVPDTADTEIIIESTATAPTTSTRCGGGPRQERATSRQCSFRGI